MKTLGVILLVVVIIILVCGVDVFTCPECRGVWLRRNICRSCGGDGRIALFDYILLELAPHLENSGSSEALKEFQRKLEEFRKNLSESSP